MNCSIKQLDNDLDNVSDKVMQSAWSKLRTYEIVRNRHNYSDHHNLITHVIIMLSTNKIKIRTVIKQLYLAISCSYAFSEQIVSGCRYLRAKSQIYNQNERTSIS